MSKSEFRVVDAAMFGAEQRFKYPEMKSYELALAAYTKEGVNPTPDLDVFEEAQREYRKQKQLLEAALARHRQDVMVPVLEQHGWTFDEWESARITRAASQD